MTRAARNSMFLFLTALAWAPSALANPMDITLSRFVTQECGDGTATSPYCGDVADHEAFRDLSRELGFAMAPFVLSPPETLGYSGFHFGLAGQITIINKDEDYWINGTEEKKPHGALFLSAIQVRKGLPAGFELGTTLGYMASTEQVALGLDVKFSPFEGFRRGAGGAFPDMALRAGVNQLIGEDELNITTVGLDASLSYPITILQQATLTPYVAYQYMWIIIDAEVVDGTPDRNFTAECGEPLMNDCSHGDGTYGDVTDSNNMIDFGRQIVNTSRLIFGLRFIYEYLAFTAQYSFGVPHQKIEFDNDEPVVHQIAFGIGADF
ncbi:MAG: hypothetical protein JRG91_03515 [Deltaproteobacteria bacterium]|nr:hypothetical protein [Deltaproteobacteria bacterium]